MPNSDAQGFLSKVPDHKALSAFLVILALLGIPATVVGFKPAVASMARVMHPEYRDVTVVRTCGKVRGSNCVLTERAAPRRDARKLMDHEDGATLTVVCQVEGASVKASELTDATNVWSRTKQGGFVSNAYLEGVNPYKVTTPCRK